MTKHLTVTLGHVAYQVPPMDIGQIEDFTELDTASKKWTFMALAVLLRRATPAIGNLREIEATPGQLKQAIEEIMKFSGYELETKNPPAPE